MTTMKNTIKLIIKLIEFNISRIHIIVCYFPYFISG